MNTLSMLFALEKFRKSLPPTVINKGIKKIPLAIPAYRLLYQLLKPKDAVLIEVNNSKMYIDLNQFSIGRTLLTDGIWEQHMTSLFKSAVREGMVVVDVGANLGYYSLLAARLVAENGRVFAFEPGPENFALLCRSIEANGFRNVIPVQKAVSDKTGRGKLFVCSEFRGDHTLYDNSDGRTSIEIQTVSLDEFFRDKGNKVDVIKVDAEGAEMAIIQGMKGILEANPDLILFTEFFPRTIRAFGHSPKEYVKRIAEYGFKVYCIDEEHRQIEPLHLESLDSFIDGLLQKGIWEDWVNLLCLRGRATI